MGEFASKGVAGTGLGLGIAGLATALVAPGLLNGGCNGGGLFNLGGCNNANMAAGGMALNAIAERDAKIAKLEAERHSDTKGVEIYQQTLRDNTTLRDQLFQFINPLATEAAANRERIAVLEAQHTSEVEKALLREQLIQSKIDNCCCEMNGKIDRVAQTASCGISQLQNAVACINNTLGGITKTIVPKDAICPEYMNRYNSWTAPTTTTPAA
ncbi:MAG: hypothetical protein ACI4SV_05950 [Duodenibacillus sp.]